MLHFLLIIACLLPIRVHASDIENKAVILAYHRIDEPEHIDSSLSFEQFQEHIKELQNNDYTILPLTEIVTALKNKTPLPDKTIAITFESGYASIGDNAIPLLIENNIPFTIFIASESTKIPTHLDWKHLQKISKYDGASFGILPAQYKHISKLPSPESTRLINQSRITFKENMGAEAKLFSYPFGEISSDLQKIVTAQNFDAALGLHSGAAHDRSNMLTLPRFTMTEQYADIERFRMITSTKPLPIKDLEPQDHKLTEPLTQIGFTATLEQESFKNLSCHISGQEKPIIEIIENRVEIIPSEPIFEERTRLNCTLPAHNGDKKQWRWLGMLFH